MADISWRRLNRGVIEVNVDFTGAADSACFLLSSDEHLDNAHCDREMLADHLEQTKERGGYVLNGGDLGCLMQGKYDRRSDRSELMPQFQGNNYLDSVAQYIVDFLEPWKDRFVCIGRGNHETSILKHHETDITERVVGALNDRGGNIVSAGYGTWVLFRLRRDKQRKCVRMFRHHGYGGSSPVTKGVIHTARTAVWLPDADIVWMGHTHTEYVVPISRQRISRNGEIYYDEQMHVRTPGYKAGLTDNYEGWATERGFAPTTVGAMMLNFKFDCRRRVHDFVFDFERMK